MSSSWADRMSRLYAKQLGTVQSGGGGGPGRSSGWSVGIGVGAAVAPLLGSNDGIGVWKSAGSVGMPVGVAEGAWLGMPVGVAEGTWLGMPVGCALGWWLGGDVAVCGAADYRVSCRTY